MKKFTHQRFEPSGMTTNRNIPFAKSIVDYIFRWIALKFLPAEDLMFVGINDVETITNGNGKSELEKLTKMADDMAVKSEDDEDIKDDEVVYQQTAIDLYAQDCKATFDMQADAPVCDTCGSMMVRSGACYKCMNCGSTSGCS